MSDELIVRHCSPTLAGMKTGNLFTCLFESDVEMRTSMRHWNQKFRKKGLRVLPLRYCNGRALIYMYRPARLSQDLQHATACRLLQERGYTSAAADRCVVHLKKRINECEKFPHEIGLFLGYPPEDVCGFIENKPGSCKYVGCWKVYGDTEAAKKIFAKYKKCTAVYCAKLARGKSIDRLAVAG